jgi:multidrug efflux pump subunit AcrA (membrane-fusion protein)
MGVKVSFLREEDTARAAAPPAASVNVAKAAIKSDGGSTIVFVLKDDHVERRAVRAGLETGDQVEVLSGLTAGERIVVDPPPQLKDRDRVRIR